MVKFENHCPRPMRIHVIEVIYFVVDTLSSMTFMRRSNVSNYDWGYKYQPIL